MTQRRGRNHSGEAAAVAFASEFRPLTGLIKSGNLEATAIGRMIRHRSGLSFSDTARGSYSRCFASAKREISAALRASSRKIISASSSQLTKDHQRLFEPAHERSSAALQASSRKIISASSSQLTKDHQRLFKPAHEKHQRLFEPAHEKHQRLFEPAF
ncbi:hypothetical protein FHS19_004715 [Paenibacillus rhizosphaerae]|uniref:Uncharacterized protein n=1 Tax=Paenibacillus rhizosphaerae TaxID=297318 RepID=A0A839TWP3_9BACL|nr:hypothetical protein [Paenibacillus rhizosphaerae]